VRVIAHGPAESTLTDAAIVRAYTASNAANPAAGGAA
jgi:hypothetical protein